MRDVDGGGFGQDNAHGHAHDIPYPSQMSMQPVSPFALAITANRRGKDGQMSGRDRPAYAPAK
jgi:hypothetical protein